VPDILKKLQDAGVNRLSVGVQSFDNDILNSVYRSKRCGSGAQIKERLASIKGMFDTLNVDMIFNFPNQTMDMLAEEIKALNAEKGKACIRERRTISLWINCLTSTSANPCGVSPSRLN
jgi:histone acetyltransferase (RNA polymerase elongator complex component)